MVQFPRTKKTEDIIEERAKVGTPVKKCPILQPPATDAPKPIRIPPIMTCRYVLGSLGILNLNSFEASAAIKAPIIIPIISSPVQFKGFAPVKPAIRFDQPAVIPKP